MNCLLYRYDRIDVAAALPRTGSTATDMTGFIFAAQTRRARNLQPEDRNAVIA
ncbi:hypothetical protein AZOA_44630 [Azoarcus sp. Aa7]|nr:hypothetical protein [Azoarcus sp. Aa7]